MITSRHFQANDANSRLASGLSAIALDDSGEIKVFIFRTAFVADTIARCLVQVVCSSHNTFAPEHTSS